MNKKYALITTTTLTLLAVRFRRNLIKSDSANKMKGEALYEILKIFDQSMDEIEKEMHELYEAREKGDRKDA